MQIRQFEEYAGRDWWKWAVWLDGSSNELNEVEYVEWRLHPTFPDPVRRATDRGTGFRLETGGWGVFPIHAAVHLKDGTTLKLKHHLQLHYPDGRKNLA